jgi:alkanesulfonate monooxygenase SsuD/methylene tetrahydromethanopterin reductase-like flavin-dependent oxidoreductase (luciferase family)
MRMKLGYFTMPLHPMGRDYGATLREDREAILLAEELGFVEAFVGEHVTDTCETITSCLMFIASLADATKRIRLGSATVNLPNTHPAAVASQVAMLDTMLEGRFLFGISPGGLLSDAEMFGNLDHDRTAMFVEAIDHIIALWTGEPPYVRNGKFWTLGTPRTLIAEIGMGVMVKPWQKPHPPILVTVTAPFSKGLVAAAERGWDPISANFLQPEWVASHWPMYREGCAKGGRSADPRNWRVAKSIFVADDAATARRYAKSADGPYGHYFGNLGRKLNSSGRTNLFKHDRAMPDAAVTIDYILDTLVVCGTVGSVVDQLLAFRERIGPFGTLLYAGHDWGDPALARRSMKLMAQEVMPAINRAIGESG